MAFGFAINGSFFREKNYLFNYEIGPNLKVDNENYINKCLIINDDQKENQRHGKRKTKPKELILKKIIFFLLV